MNLRLLGPLELRWRGRLVDIAQPRRRAVLAVLAADTGRPVDVGTLVERVWGDTPPDGAKSALYAHISRLRGLFESMSSPSDDDLVQVPPAAPHIRRSSGGYLLEADELTVDLLRFRALVARGREPHRPDVDRADALLEALHLWRGVPLAGLTGVWAERTRTAWAQERVDAALDWAAVLLRQERYAEVPAVVHPLLAEQPLCEPLAAALIRSLAGVGRTAEAVDTYTGLRRRLACELGVDPGRKLRLAYEEMLRRTGTQPAAPGASSVTAGSRTRSPAPAPAPAPAQLPTDVRHLGGREQQLLNLTRHLTPLDAKSGGDGAGGRAGAATAVVCGIGGVGKTALAVRWAHLVRETFPDGQLYVDLRGYDPHEAVSARQALAGFLTALGVPAQEIPPRLDDRAARYRSAVDGRRLLVLLDNAASAAHVRPLLPGSATCTTVITSRDALSSLVTLHDAYRVQLDVLSPPAALALLGELIGTRADADPTVAAVLAEQCGRLPLALRVAAELAVSRPRDPLTRLVDELSDHRRRLDLLASGDGDPRAAVRAVFSWSYDRLPEHEARLFRLLGLHPGLDTDVHAAAALAGDGVHRTRRSLDALSSAHMAHRTAPDRYGMHDLLRAYAAELALLHDAAEQRDAALDRLTEHCLAATATAMDVLYPAERHLRPDVALPATPLPPLRTADECRTWLSTAQRTLVALCSRTPESGPSPHTVRIATTLHRHYERAGHFSDALTLHTHALSAARAAGDTRGEVDVLACIGAVHRRLGDYTTAHRHHADGLSLCRGLAHPAGEARHLTHVGVLHELQGRYREAAAHHERAAALFRAAGDAHGEADSLNNLGIVGELLADYPTATEHYRRALALYRTTGHTFGEASTLGNLGILLARQDDPAAAADLFERALPLFRRLGHAGAEAHALSNLGDARRRQGRHGEAAAYQRQALDHFRETNEPYGQAGALNGLGEALCGAGRHDEALSAHAEALDVARCIGEKEEQARAHTGCARILQDGQRRADALAHLRQALALYTELGSPRHEEMRDLLRSLTPAPSAGQRTR